MTFADHLGTSIELIEGAEYDRPRSFSMPRWASSAAIALSTFGHLWPPAAHLADQGHDFW
jgi:hypothetical protein